MCKPPVEGSVCKGTEGGGVFPYPWPNNPVERTAHSTGFLPVRGSVVCGPPLTAGVRQHTLTWQLPREGVRTLTTIRAQQEELMYINLAEWSVMLLCLSMACAIGGGLYEHIVLTPLWSASPPSSFAIIQPGTGVPLQKFWIPVHATITIFLILSLVLTWKQIEVRRFLLIGLGSYIVMYSHARLEWSLLHPRDASVSKSASGLPALCGVVSESRELDVLDVVQGAA
jgi:hypothetical protein